MFDSLDVSADKGEMRAPQGLLALKVGEYPIRSRDCSDILVLRNLPAYVSSHNIYSEAPYAANNT